MKRREFLGATGAIAVSAAPVARATSFLGIDGKYIDRITARTDRGDVALEHASGQTWAAGKIEVQIDESADSLIVRVRAPGTELRSVTLEFPEQPIDLVLGDHWERTYGDVGWHKPSPAEHLPWYFIAKHANWIDAFGVRTGAGAFCYWQLADFRRRLVIDTSSGGGGVGVQLGNRTLDAAEIVNTRSARGESAFSVLRRFVKSLCQRPRLVEKPVYGINDWYFAYGKNSDALILEHTELMAPFAEGLANRPFSVIDAGWFEGPPSAPDDCCFGVNMDTPNARFKDMSALAANIRKLGMRPGLWTRPLCATEKVNASLLLPRIAGRDDPQRPILDPTIPENLERIARYFEQYRRWNYDLVKIDFTSFDILGKWGFEMLRDGALTRPGWRMHDVSRTNAEIIRDLYAAMRAAAGDTLLIGCNTVSHLSAGVFEINRIGDDTSGKEWDRTRKMGVNTLAFRGVHHDAFYAADGDCVGLTPQVPWEKNRQWMELVAKSGTPLFISAQPDAVGAQQKQVIKACFELASRKLPLGEPLDWMSNAWPRQWRLNGKRESFDW
jgi:alpha-galactosidase